MLNAPQNSNAATAPVMSLNPAKNATGNNTQGLNTAAAKAGAIDPKTGAPKKGVEEAQDRFLKLLVTQMKNQDPLNPMDNAQVTSQMAQLSTVSGIDKLNATLAALSSSMTASHSMQAASMIGHVVVVPGNKMELKNSKGAAALDLAQPADNVTVHIKDAGGNVVRNLNLGSQPAGILPIQWDGKNDASAQVGDGNYQFSASTQLGAEKASAKTLSYGLVNGVKQKPEGASLTVEQLGDVSLDSVKQIL
ncbi:MAG TPA: flagellar hook assembly protein FlgD [Gallionellaceae bacterium]|nr:flagellar hook assembly protein FlgD [Gallionellaceae bacterium]HQS74734.1 flagellar hook assembly protein FlgD [Gallionellaceae bacterium]